jgi:hypothetical protein
MVHNRNKENFDDIAETALEEESAIISKQEIYKVEPGNPTKCGNWETWAPRSSMLYKEESSG